MRFVQLEESFAQSARSGTRFAGSLVSSTATSWSGVQKVNPSIPYICIDQPILLQIIQSLEADDGDLGQVARNRRQVLGED